MATKKLAARPNVEPYKKTGEGACESSDRWLSEPDDNSDDVECAGARALALFGIVIRMFVETGAQHNRPHFHAFYQEHTAVFAIDTIECVTGGLPKPQQRLVEAWAEIHRAELQRDWELLQSGEPPSRSTHSGRSMAHPIHRVTRFSIVGPHTLLVAFTDGTEHRIDFRPVLHGPLFGPLQDPATFDAVRLDPEVGTLVWPNDADFDPATLHDWPQVGEELAARARTWGQSASDVRANTRVEPTRR